MVKTGLVYITLMSWFSEIVDPEGRTTPTMEEGEKADDLEEESPPVRSRMKAWLDSEASFETLSEEFIESAPPSVFDDQDSLVGKPQGSIATTAIVSEGEEGSDFSEVSPHQPECTVPDVPPTPEEERHMAMMTVMMNIQAAIENQTTALQRMVQVEGAILDGVKLTTAGIGQLEKLSYCHDVSQKDCSRVLKEILKYSR